MGLATSVIFARWLLVGELATYRQAFLVYNVTLPILTLSLPQALYYFLPRNVDRERAIVNSNLLLLTALGLLFAGALSLGLSHEIALRFKNPRLEPALKMLVLYPVVMFPASALSACLVAKERVLQLTVYNVVSQLLVAVVAIATCVMSRDALTLVGATVAAGIIVALPAFPMMWSACSSGTAMPERSVGVAMLRYAVPLGMASLFGNLAQQLSGIVVSTYRSPLEYAIFAVGATEIPLIGVVTGSISTVLLADMARMCRQGESQAALRLFRLAAVRSGAILLPVMMFLLAVARPFIETLFSAKYRDSTVVFQLFLLLLPARVVFFGPALMALGRTRHVLVRSVVDLLLTAALSVLFVRWFGSIGAVVALVTTIFVWTVPFNVLAISSGFGVRMYQVLPLRHLLRIVLLSAIPAAGASIWRLLPHWSAPAQLGLSTLIYAPLASAMLWRAGYLPTDFLPRLPLPRRWSQLLSAGRVRDID